MYYIHSDIFYILLAIVLGLKLILVSSRSFCFGSSLKAQETYKPNSKFSGSLGSRLNLSSSAVKFGLSVGSNQNSLSPK